MVENYFSIYAWAIDENGGQYKGPMNQVNNVARVFGPEDTGVVTPNSDTPYSYLIIDLRAEPIMVTLPSIEKDRYYSLQLVDLYSHNVDYLGTRREGNEGGNFLIAGPNWDGKVPKGIKRVVRIETELMFSQFRTQLKGADDLPNVIRIQKGYKAQPLSAFLGQQAPAVAPAIEWPPITRDQIVPEAFRYANFLLQFAPVIADESEMRAKFEEIGIKAGGIWPPQGLDDETLGAIMAGQADALADIDASVAKTTSSLDLFGTRQDLAGRTLARAVAARMGLYGNTAVEALYPAFPADSDGKPLDTGSNKYTITFAADQFPPVDAFWSLTMYDGKTRYLVANPIHRYLLNSPMLPDFVRNGDGTVTFYISHESPGQKLEPNWLPGPDGAAWLVMRLYMPHPEALNGKWTPPQIVRVK
ncbi:MAG: DUF1254 domain-containing protein [Rhodospirillales bacterium]|nr:DUF1254 domain-containing protein [Rhodospirillales bacterium]